MLITEIVGNESSHDLSGYTIDELHLEWYELNKRLQRKQSSSGVDIALKFISEGVALRDGDILHVDSESSSAVVVRVIEAEAIVISPRSMVEMATVCYEIGNKHMPLFVEGEQILLPFEAPMFRWLESAGYRPQQQMRVLVNRLRSHSHSHDDDHDHSHSHDHSHDHSHGHHHHH